MSWKTETQSLKNPWKTWLQKTEFYIAENNVGLLVVDDEEFDIYNSLELLGKAYIIAKKLHPQLSSIAVLQGEIYKLLLEGHVTIHDIKINFTA
jgi:hypothetical protein